jgi:hypothetical protein
MCPDRVQPSPAGARLITDRSISAASPEPRAMNRTHALALACALLAFPVTAPAQAIEVRYREPADAFEILDHVSNWWPGYVEEAYGKFWADSVGVQRGDSAVFARYARIRERYFRKEGQEGGGARREGSGLFTDRAALAGDPVGAAFYSSEGWEEAFGRLRAFMAPEEVAFLRSFYARFRRRWAPLAARTRARTAASRAATDSTLAEPEVVAYLARVRGLFGAGPAPAFTALYVWWPSTERTLATPSGPHLLMRVRPAPGEVVNSADVVAHEAVHVYAALQTDSAKQAVSAAVLDRCTPPAGARRLAVLEEPIATVLGNIEFRRRFQPRRFQWGRQWYGDPWVDVFARLLYPVLIGALDSGQPLETVSRDAGALCAVLARSWDPAPAAR